MIHVRLIPTAVKIARVLIICIGFIPCIGFILFPMHSSIAHESEAAMEPTAAPPVTRPQASGAVEIRDLEQRMLQNGLVDVQRLDPSIRVDLKYANAHNFMGANVYDGLSRAYLRPSAAAKLIRASELLQQRHAELRLLVIDAVRPRSVQHKMWKRVAGTPMQRYVANPHSGSMHNYGTAVDVTLYCTEAGEALDMGTPVDHFGPLAHPNLESKFLQEGKLSAQQIANRRILRSAMRDAGWIVLPIEWWHFDAFPVKYTRRTYSIIE
jgi:zinc D-Ala-D-Ala dipeptidase